MDIRYGKFKSKEEKGFYLDLYGFSSEWIMVKDCWVFGGYIQWLGVQLFIGPISICIQRINE